MEERLYFCAAHLDECVQVCDQIESSYKDGVDAIANLLRYGDVASCDVGRKSKARCTVISHKFGA